MAHAIKILAVSDRVVDHLYSSDARSYYHDVNLLVGCGDLPYYYLDFLTSALDVRMLYVLGNHDSGVQYTADRGILRGVRGGVNLHGKLMREDGLLVAGLQGCLRYRPNAPLMYTEGEMVLQAARLLPKLLRSRVQYGRAADVWISHAPPFGIHDGPDAPHIGFKTFLTLMRVFRPRYWLHGHVHRYRPHLPTTTQFHHTEVINVYPWRTLTVELP